MLGAPAGSLRKALGSRATARPETTPGRAHSSADLSAVRLTVSDSADRGAGHSGVGAKTGLGR